jgi:GT2 family glycosyltransferase
LNQDLIEKYQKAYASIGPYVQEIIVVENGSKVLKDVIHFDNPIGYAAAVNAGLKQATGDFVLILNSDAAIETIDWASRLALRFLSDESIGIVIPWLKNDGEPRHSPQIVGPCWAVRRETLDRIGNLCSDYGSGYYEDTDFFMTAITAGFKVVAEEGVKVTHAGQSTFKALYTEDEIKKLSSTNYEKYTSKWHRWPEFS